MKRFLTDALLIVLLVSILTYVSEPKKKEDISLKINTFEENIALHKPTQQMVSDTHLNMIHENKAAKLAKAGSDTIVQIMETSLDLVSEFFQGFAQ